MVYSNVCVGGDGGPLVVLQAAAVPQWQGASGFDNSLMAGGDVETDYDVICAAQTTGNVINRYSRDMLILWDSEFGAGLLPPDPLLLPLDAIVLAPCYNVDDYPSILPRITECLQRRRPEHSSQFNIVDTTLRLQVAADWSEPSYLNKYLDIPVSPGLRRCDVYIVEHSSVQDEVIVISSFLQPNSAL